MKLNKITISLLLALQVASSSALAIDQETIKAALAWAAAHNGGSVSVATPPPTPTPAQVVGVEEADQLEVANNAPSILENLGPSTSGSSQNTLNYATVVNIADYKGSTFFALMQGTVKPALDIYAKKGFQVIRGSQVEAALKKVDAKVSRNAISDAGSVELLKKISDQLYQSGRFYTLYDLPSAIVGGKDRYGLSTFYALVSGGGVAVKINDQNFAYNVNYGTGDVAQDEMTGRSFGEAPGRLALDASDAHYLQMLEKYVRTSGDRVQDFYQSLLEILTNNDTSNFSRISNEGQAVASDFIAVYVAEQDRHLMANLQSHHWDQALLEVTLLGAFHAGQDKVAVMYNGLLTSTTEKQITGCSTNAKVQKAAGMVDYWQFSKSTDPKSCSRSGINVTNRDFRKLESKISYFEKNRNPQLVANVTRHFTNIQQTGNIFLDLSNFLINFKTARSFDVKTLQLSKDFTAFLMQVKKDANEISKSIVQGQ